MSCQKCGISWKERKYGMIFTIDGKPENFEAGNGRFICDDCTSCEFCHDKIDINAGRVYYGGYQQLAAHIECWEDSKPRRNDGLYVAGQNRKMF